MRVEVSFQGDVAAVEDRRWAAPSSSELEEMLNAWAGSLTCLGPSCGSDVDVYLATEAAKLFRGQVLTEIPEPAEPAEGDADVVY